MSTSAPVCSLCMHRHTPSEDISLRGCINELGGSNKRLHVAYAVTRRISKERAMLLSALLKHLPASSIHQAIVEAGVAPRALHDALKDSDRGPLQDGLKDHDDD